MDIRLQILQEHSKQNALFIANYACQSTEHFKELMMCFLDVDYRIAQRAAWSVSWAARKKPEMIAPYVKTLVEQLSRKNVHMAVIRNSVRILEEIDIPEVLHGELLNICFEFIENPRTPAAIKAFSLTILYRLSAVYPDIKQELKLVINDRWENETAAFRSRGKKILNAL